MSYRQSPKKVFFQGFSEWEQFFLMGKENSSYIFLKHRSRKTLCVYCDSPLAGFTWPLMCLVRGLDHRCLVLQFWVLGGNLNISDS